jgi:hypothetical protein
MVLFFEIIVKYGVEVLAGFHSTNRAQYATLEIGANHAGPQHAYSSMVEH